MLIKLNPIFLPDSFSLVNTGSICYFNSLLQALASCTSLLNISFQDKTKTEYMFRKFVEQVKDNKIDSNISSEILKALQEDIPYFGQGQESASEAFTLLINTINNPILTNLFLNRSKYTIQCLYCNYTTKEIHDYSIVLNMFHSDTITNENLLIQKNIINDYKCDNCGKQKILKTIRLTMLPEIIFITFNIYYIKKIHNFPIFIHLSKSNLHYKLVSQIEHSGNLSGGHYWAKVLRKNSTYYLCNDSFYEKTDIKPSANTYIILYHLI